MSSQTRRRGRSDQGGYALPLFAIVLVALLALAGFGVDVWNWWYNAQKAQRAADAAALAGVIYMPGDLPNARQTARDVAAANGYPSSAVNPSVGTRANRLNVEVNSTVSNHFVSLLGIGTTTISRDAEAEYTGVVETGSPINQMGNQPIGPGDSNWAGAVSTTEATNPQVWAQIAGPGNSKENGDRFAAGLCSTANYNCSGGTNAEYTADGYYYTIRLDVGSGDLGQSLLVDVYDPAFVQSGDNCTDFLASDNTATRNSLAALGDRYNSNNAALNNTYCPGDHRIASVTYGSGFPTVQFRTAGPDSTPWSYTDNFTNAPISACDGSDTSFGTYPTVVNRLRPYGTVAGESANNFVTDVTNTSSYLNAMYHRWVRVCAMSLSSLGINSAGQYDLTLNSRIVGSGAGHNRYAIRAGLGSTTTSTTASGGVVSVFAAGAMPLYQNATSSTAAFYLARVLPGAANRVLNVEFFDTGDGSGSGTIQILPPADSNVGGGVFGSSSGTSDNCTVTLSGGATPNISGDACRLNSVSAANGYQGQRVVVSVPIPDNYDCGTGPGGTILGTDCWTRVRFVWSSNVQDTTTWRASIIGDPVRLTE